MVDFIPLSNVFELAERNYTFLKGSHEIYHADKHMCCFSFCFVLCVSVPFSQPLEFMMMYERSVYIVRSTVCKALVLWRPLTLTDPPVCDIKKYSTFQLCMHYLLNVQIGACRSWPVTSHNCKLIGVSSRNPSIHPSIYIYIYIYIKEKYMR